MTTSTNNWQRLAEILGGEATEHGVVRRFGPMRFRVLINGDGARALDRGPRKVEQNALLLCKRSALAAMAFVAGDESLAVEVMQSYGVDDEDAFASAVVNGRFDDARALICD